MGALLGRPTPRQALGAAITGDTGSDRIGHHGGMPSSDPRKVFPDLPFSFPNDEFPANLGAVVQRTVFYGELPARDVIHDADNMWFVGDGIDHPNEPGACIVGHIHHVVNSTRQSRLLPRSLQVVSPFGKARANRGKSRCPDTTTTG